MKKIICLLLLICWGCLLFVPVFAGYEQDGIIRHDSLVTSNDPTRYSVFTVKDGVISAHDSYGNDTVTYEMPKIPSDSGFGIIVAELSSGQRLRYRVNYEAGYGWYFPEHSGLVGENARVIENYTQARVEVTVQYLIGDSRVREDLSDVLAQIRELTGQITEGLSCDYDKARAVSAWVADNIYYDYLASNDGVDLEVVALLSVLENRRGICSGFANLTAAMYQAAGIKAVTVIGNALSLDNFDELPVKSNRHEWTAFWYEEEQRWVMADSGWDSLNRYDGEGYTRREDSPRKFFDITPLALAQTHRAVKAEYRDYFAVEQVEFSELPEIQRLTDSEESDSEAVTTPEYEEEPEPRRSNVFPYLVPILIVVVGILIFGIIHESLY
jgi:hypothetical protein